MKSLSLSNTIFFSKIVRNRPTNQVIARLVIKCNMAKLLIQPGFRILNHLGKHISNQTKMVIEIFQCIELKNTKNQKVINFKQKILLETQ